MTIPLSPPGLVEITLTGASFSGTPAVRLIGPNVQPLILVSLSGSTLTGFALTPQLAVGFYDVEVTNPDGQVAVAPGAIEVTP